MSTGAVVVLVIVVVLVLAAGAWFVMQQSRRRRLRERFGPEYDRRIQETDDRRVAERELAEREKRHASYELRPLSEADRKRYSEQWLVVQEQFVDQPGEAVVAAERLVVVVMRDRGYPTDNFEQQASDLSVEHAHLVDRFRAGHDIRTRHEQAGVSTEELRQALTHYREMFDSLLGHRHDATDDRAGTPEALDAERAYHAGREDAGTHGHAVHTDPASADPASTAVPENTVLPENDPDGRLTADRRVAEQPRHTQN